MINSVYYEGGDQIEIQNAELAEGSGTGNTTPSKESTTHITVNGSPTAVSPKQDDDPQGKANVLCTHDGVLLKKANAEHIAHINTSGSISITEYGCLNTSPNSSPEGAAGYTNGATAATTTPPKRRLYVEWRPNDSILIAADSQDQGDWALVDTISRRTRTASECKAFSMKSSDSPPSASSITSGSPSSSLMASKPYIIRINLDLICSIEVKHRGQVVRLLRKSDHGIHSEFFFQHGNADLFLRTLGSLHIIDFTPLGNRNGEEYVILSNDKQKLKKTFAELDIGEIKASPVNNESWLTNKLAEFFITIPDYVQPQRTPRSRPDSYNEHIGQLKRRQQLHKKSQDKYKLEQVHSNSASSESRSSSADKTPEELELENIKEFCEKVANNLPERSIISRGSPLTASRWLDFQNNVGVINDPRLVKEIIFHGGITKNVRSEIWKYLLNYYQWSDSELERVQRRKQKSVEYYKMKAQWLSFTSTQEMNFTGYRERKAQIEKDVKRTDRSMKFFEGDNNPNLVVLQGVLMTYVMYNFDLGYVQGMSDLLAPILAIQENEVDAFWCFVGFMDIVYDNFGLDQSAMKTQFKQLRRLLEFVNPRLFRYLTSIEADNMFFTFRWLLVWYRREFNNEDILTLWEVMWTRLPCINFQLIISLAILDQHTNFIIDAKLSFTNILKYVNELSLRINVTLTLEVAEAIYLQIKNAENLPNDIRQIIGEPLIVEENFEGAATPERKQLADSEDDLYELVPEASPEDLERQQQLLEEAFERSIFSNHM